MRKMLVTFVLIASFLASVGGPRVASAQCNLNPTSPDIQGCVDQVTGLIPPDQAEQIDGAIDQLKTILLGAAHDGDAVTEETLWTIRAQLETLRGVSICDGCPPEVEPYLQLVRDSAGAAFDILDDGLISLEGGRAALVVAIIVIVTLIPRIAH